MPDWLGQTFQGLLFILGVGLFVAAEYSYVSARRSRVEAIARKGSRAAKQLRQSLRELSLYIAAFDIGITFFNLMVGRFFEPFVSHAIEGVIGSVAPSGVSFAIGITFSTFLTVVIGEVVPKYLAIHSPERVAMWLVFPMLWFRIVAYPLIWLVKVSGKGFLRLFNIRIEDEESEAVSRDELLLLVKSGGAEGLLDKKHADLVSRALRLDQLTAQDIMIHRLDIRWLDISTKREELFKKLAELPHTRFPVCRGDIDDVVGLIYIHDVIKHCEEDDFTLESIVREATVVPENLSMDKIVSRMRESKTQMLIVVDEYGGTSGLITLEDVVEEVFGELDDRIEGERAPIAVLPSGRVSCKASVRFDELVTHLGIDLPDEPSTDTLATLIVDQLGRVPKPGDHIDSPLGLLVVENMARRRITRVSLHLTQPLQEQVAKALSAP
ncbi:MAG: hemolysin family protein [Fimbriimonadaceae bacterium]